ncbi:glycosyltransferase family 4 protein [Haloferax massiliensis]|uniref:Glycosyl transferases group 1 n=1 Tax=Haloferax massiliensis TaxID=1476858 RepID=A0A0D6JLF1_9EURY|nr:glycosyltransferase family 4 protein [Haloferax massiliensis]CQR48726.1 Glycosyl transferases group 1 [Haloferax massiliensis]
MVDILQLHRKPPYPPGSGADRRVWECGKKFAELGTSWVAAPWDGDTPPEETVETLDIATPWLNSKVSRIYFWTLLMAARIDILNEIFLERCLDAINSKGLEPDLVVSECPQLSPAALTIARRSDAPFLINKHNAEFRVVEQFLDGRSIPKLVRDSIVDRHQEFEQRMIDNADAVVFMSESDCESFDLSSTTYSVIPNGTDYSKIGTEKSSTQHPSIGGLDTSKQSCVFVGAYDYDPNKDAAQIIINEIAPTYPEMQFLLIGRNPPSTDQPNVLTPGFVDDLGACLGYADIALCPLSMGSGTKLKMLDYMAAGLPIVTTSVGIQGLSVEDGETALVRDSTAGIIEAIEQLTTSKSLRDDLGSNAQELGKQYDWGNLFEEYDRLIGRLV